jgi:hypothetical protein
MSPVDRLDASPRRRATSKRTGHRCQGPAVRGWRVYRFHGARGGAPKGPANGAYRHGQFTKEATENRARLREPLKLADDLTGKMRAPASQRPSQ